MRSFEIAVAEETDSPSSHRSAASAAPRSGRRDGSRAAREVLSLFVTASSGDIHTRVGSRHATAALRDLAVAAVDLGHKGMGKALVRFYDEPWEMCLERFGDVASLSVYRAGPHPTVTVYDARVPFLEVVDALRGAVDAALTRDGAPEELAADLTRAAAELGAVDRTTRGALLHPMALVTLEADRDAIVSVGCDFALRAAPANEVTDAPDAGDAVRVERTDLHALLFRGRLRVEARGRAVELGEAHPFLFAERFLELAMHSLGAWERGREHFVREDCGGVSVGVRTDGDGNVLLTFTTLAQVAPNATGFSSLDAPRPSYTFPALSVADVVECAVAFGRALVRSLLRRDRSQCMNLRASSFRRALRDAEATLREVHRDDMVVAKEPELYRSFAERARPSAAPAEVPAARLRYAQRWRALVPGIDLRATFLCGDRLVVGAALETFCLDRATGRVHWRVPTVRAMSVVTPGGIARIVPDGFVEVHDFGTGEVTLRARVRPRLGGPPSGTVINAPQLPRLLVLTEGERHLVAIDLASGEARWRYAWGRGGTPRLRRHGRLLYVTSGDSALTALDVQTGEVVWRVRSRLRFRSAPVVDHDRLFAVAGGMSSAAELWTIDPYSGEVLKQVAVADGAATVEGTPVVAGDAIVCTLRDRYGVRLRAFRRESGEVAFASETTVAPIGTSWLSIDDVLIGNTPTGEILGLDTATGAVRYRHLLGRVLESDVPRRLEPVLRSGALFVPHVDVHVFRPSDGAKLATIGPCDAIPDLLRVDERCDVYVAEESGHLVSFAAGPRLSLVR